MLTKYLKSPAATCGAIYENLRFSREIDALNATLKERCGTDCWYALRVKAPFVYMLVRRYKPRLMIETGVQNGISTYFILKAMNENGVGSLISIDLPFKKGEVRKYDGHEDTSWVPEGEMPGWLVTKELAGDRWKLVLGDSKKVLPGLNVKDVDFFLHDSEHSYATQQFEYEWAYKNMRTGVISSDDIEWNEAWNDFLKAHGLPKIDYPYAYTIKR